MENNKSKKTRLPKCPNGTRRKKGECVPIKVSDPVQREISREVEEPVQREVEEPVQTEISREVEEPVDDRKTKKARLPKCPKGTRRKKDKCVQVNPPIVEIEYPKESAEEPVEKTPIPQPEPKPTTKTRDYLYPSLDDPLFNQKIAIKQEFLDATYDGKIHDIEKQAELLCNAKFELSPHQIFVKNFLSSQTPYNSLLLYHGLGTGKTCSAIGVAEEMRQYGKLTGKRDKILVVASPNVQDNFRQQLFNEKKLVKMTNSANPNEYTWNIESCVGNTLLQEVNPNSIRNLSREKLVSNINALIQENYQFMGYIQFANVINTVIGTSKNKEMEIRNIQKFFNGRLVIIDEVHNIRIADDANKELQQVASLLMRVAKQSVGLRLLLLSATPMFNSYKEIVWLTNLLNANDKRDTIQLSDVFASDGSFKEATDGKESGKDLLRRKLTGYVSYVRGENPYTFPYRVWPKTFDQSRVLTLPPKKQMNGQDIDQPLQHLDVYVNRVSPDTHQSRVYLALIDHMRKTSRNYYTAKGELREMPSFENLDSFGYTLLQKPLEALNIAYPYEDLTSFEKTLGKTGLSHVVNFEKMYQDNPLKHSFEYKPAILKKYGRVFSRDELPKYSAKMAEICDQIRKSEGIVLIYSQFIDGGVVPMALALEEMGFSRYSRGLGGTKNLFKKREKGTESTGHYIMITGDKSVSPSNDEDVKYAVEKENKDGSLVKVILISKAGSEGIDFKYIRQIHILEPWFNINRVEQIIGRGVRNLSHCALPFKKRNVQIFLHVTVFSEDKSSDASLQSDKSDKSDSSLEAADLYLYRLSERKAKQIGQVTRVIKESAADCIINIEQTNFTAQKLSELVANQHIQIELSTKDENGQPVPIDFKIGDIEGTEICDYMSCEYQCNPSQSATVGNPSQSATVGNPDKSATSGDTTTYSTDNANANYTYISARIKDLYRENHSFTLEQLVKRINAIRMYPMNQIFFVLSTFLRKDSPLYLFDKYGRFGHLVNQDKFYAFQPIEIGDEKASMYERSKPVDFKQDTISLELPSGFSESKVATAQQKPSVSKSYESIIRDIAEQIELAFRPQTILAEEKNWFKNANKVLDHLRIVHQFTDTKMREYMVYHSVDVMDYEDKRVVFEHTYKTHVFSINPEIETIVAKYLQTHVMKNDQLNRVGAFLVRKEENVLLVLNPETGVWAEGDEVDQADFTEEIAAKYKVDKRSLNTIIGYAMDFKGQDMAFYYKDITLKRNKKGRRCDRSGGKAPIMQIMNALLNTNMYTEDRANIIYSGGLCVILEMLLREYEVSRKGGKRFCLTPEKAVYNEITKFSLEN